MQSTRGGVHFAPPSASGRSDTLDTPVLCCGDVRSRLAIES